MSTQTINSNQITGPVLGFIAVNKENNPRFMHIDFIYNNSIQKMSAIGIKLFNPRELNTDNIALIIRSKRFVCLNYKEGQLISINIHSIWKEIMDKKGVHNLATHIDESGKYIDDSYEPILNPIDIITLSNESYPNLLNYFQSYMQQIMAISLQR